MKAVSNAQYRRRRGLSLVGLYVVLILLAFVFLFPYYIIVRNSLSARVEITGFDWVWFPANPDFSNIADIFTKNSVLLRSMLNSAVISTLQTLGQLAVAATAGYGLARIPYRHATKVFLALVATMMVPSAVTFVPTYAVISQLGWVNTFAGIILPGVFSVFTLFIFRQFFLDFPKELEDAGRVDGLGEWGVFLRIVLPNSVGIIVALGVISFVWSWNSFLWPLVIGQNESTWTIQVAMSTFLNSYNINLPGLFAASLVGVAPLVILFFVLQRYIAQGVKLSGLKG